jgi:hypothetical protein
MHRRLRSDRLLLIPLLNSKRLSYNLDSLAGILNHHDLLATPRSQKQAL